MSDPDPVAETTPRPNTPNTTPAANEAAHTPKITIATVTYNAAELIERTIESVEHQDYPDVEHIIIDGNSSDTTLALVQHYLERNSHAEHRHEIVCRSEPDDGLYDAMNKALDLATGDYILFLNAGDTLHDHDTLSVMARMAADDVCVIYGDTDLVDEQGLFLRHRRLTPPERLTWRSFRNGMLVCHQAFAARLDIARQQHYDDEHYHYSADFDWCIRVMRQGEEQGMHHAHTHDVIADFLDVEAGTTHKHHKASLRERFRIMCRHYGILTTLAMHAWFVVRAFIKK